LGDKNGNSALRCQGNEGLFFSLEGLVKKFGTKEKRTMNKNGFLRSLMARNQNSREFFKHVISCIERQLQEFNEHYEVIVWDAEPLIIQVHGDEHSWFVSLLNEEIPKLQKQDPYALDRIIWRKLQEVGLHVEPKTEYLQWVLS
jgi:hypothetical protein